MSLAAALPRRRRRRWRPPGLREQQAIRRCCWAVAAVVISVIVHSVFADWRAFVLGTLAWFAVWRLIGTDLRRLRFSEPPIVARYLRTCWTDED